MTIPSSMSNNNSCSSRGGNGGRHDSIRPPQAAISLESSLRAALASGATANWNSIPVTTVSPLTSSALQEPPSLPSPPSRSRLNEDNGNDIETVTREYQRRFLVDVLSEAINISNEATQMTEQQQQQENQSDRRPRNIVAAADANNSVHEADPSYDAPQ